MSISEILPSGYRDRFFVRFLRGEKSAVRVLGKSVLNDMIISHLQKYYILSTWYEKHGFFQYRSDFESEHTVGKLRIIRIHWSKFHDLTPNGHCAMASRSLLI